MRTWNNEKSVIYLLLLLVQHGQNNHFFGRTKLEKIRYATLIMRYLELQFYEKYKNELGVNNGKYIEENWHRFLDGFYIALDANNINPLKLLDIFNNIHDNIKFIIEQHNLSLPFLDIIINKDPENNNI